MKGPLFNNFEGNRDGIIKEELIQYRVKNGMLTKITTVRNYYPNGDDYIDDTSYIPICEVKE